MKILYISSPNFFDVDLSLIRSLSKKVELVYLISLSKHSLNTTVLQIGNQKQEVGVFSAKIYPEFTAFNDYLNCETYVINRPISKLISLETVKIFTVLKEFISLKDPDIIHFNDFVNLGNISTLLNKRKKIITVHDPIPHIGNRSVRNKLGRIIHFMAIKKYILLNQSQLKDFSDLYSISKDNIYLSKLGVFEYYKDKFTENNQPVTDRNNILFFGRISPYKGIDILLSAFKEVNQYLPEAELTIAGKGEFEFSKYDLNNVTIINRYINPKELFDLINDSCFVVCPYIEATQSGVVMTSFSLTKPVLATDAGGLKEMVEHKKTGLICEANNLQKLSEAIITMIGNKEALVQYAKNINAIYYGNGEKGWDAITNELVEIYKSI